MYLVTHKTGIFSSSSSLSLSWSSLFVVVVVVVVAIAHTKWIDTLNHQKLFFLALCLNKQFREQFLFHWLYQVCGRDLVVIVCVNTVLFSVFWIESPNCVKSKVPISRLFSFRLHSLFSFHASGTVLARISYARLTKLSQFLLRILLIRKP